MAVPCVGNPLGALHAGIGDNTIMTTLCPERRFANQRDGVLEVTVTL